MEIVRNVREETQFEDLRMGDVFIAVDDNCVYMKTNEACEFLDNRYYYYNAVSLSEGSLVKINDWEKVIVPKNVTLTVEE